MANKNNLTRLDGSSPDIERQHKQSSSHGGGIFEIHVKGHLNREWSDWLEDMEMKLLDNGEMVLIGPIIDQAALMGVLNKLSRLNMTLLSVNKVNRIRKTETK